MLRSRPLPLSLSTSMASVLLTPSPDMPLCADA
jgi:hypothetical protein